LSDSQLPPKIYDLTGLTTPPKGESKSLILVGVIVRYEPILNPSNSSPSDPVNPFESRVDISSKVDSEQSQNG